MFSDNKAKVKEHYNLLSPYYRDLWGIHIHHGFWLTGKETKEKAQEQLIEKLSGLAQIKQGSRILDVGCGMGGSSVYLAKKFGAKVTGITISSAQVSLAQEYAKQQGAAVNFLLMDADNISLQEKFGVVWSIEAISHFAHRDEFFKKVASLLETGGRLAITDWFVSENLDKDKDRQIIKSIKSGMLVPNMNTISNYCVSIERSGLKIIHKEDLSANVAKTWDISLKIIKNKAFWKLALFNGKEFVEFLKTFQAIKEGYKSKALIYGLIVAEKN